MRYFVLVACGAMFLLSGCTVFQDDVYKLQSGYYASGGYAAVEDAIYEEFSARYGKESVFRADVEWKYDHWTVVSEQRAIGLDKYRTRIYAYPQLDGDGRYEPVVIARQEVYTGASPMGRGGPTANYSNKWSEAGRSVDLEADLANAIYARLQAPKTTGKAGGE